MAVVGFITFGFTEVVCGTQPNRFQSGHIDTASVIIHGYDYDFSTFNHPAVGDFNGKTNPLFVGGWGAAGAGVSPERTRRGGRRFIKTPEGHDVRTWITWT